MVGQVDAKLLMDNMIDCIDRMRSHPSLLLWEGANEVVPPQDWAQPMQDQVLPAMDGTRPWMVDSSRNAPWGVPVIHMDSGGPYFQQPLRTLFDLYAHDAHMTSKNEIGMGAPMNINSVVQSIPDWDRTDDKNFPLNVTFGFHDAVAYYVPTHRAIAEQFGPMPDLMEYLWIGDLFHGEFYRGVYEAANKVRPRNAGTHLWKVNAAWPSMMWELFDWYLHASSGYYGMKEALKPIHVQFSIDDSGVQVVSTQPDALKGAKVQAEIVSLQGVTESKADFTVDAAADATTVAGSLAKPFADGQAHFLALTLTTADWKGARPRCSLGGGRRCHAGSYKRWLPATVVGTVKSTRMSKGPKTVDTIGIENTSERSGVRGQVRSPYPARRAAKSCPASGPRTR